MEVPEEPFATEEVQKSKIKKGLQIILLQRKCEIIIRFSFMVGFEIINDFEHKTIYECR